MRHFYLVLWLFLLSFSTLYSYDKFELVGSELYPYLQPEGNGIVRVESPANAPFVMYLEERNSVEEARQLDMTTRWESTDLNPASVLTLSGRSSIKNFLLGERPKPILSFYGNTSLPDGVYTLYMANGVYATGSYGDVDWDLSSIVNITTSTIGQYGLDGSVVVNVCQQNNLTLRNCLKLLSTTQRQTFGVGISFQLGDPSYIGLSAVSDSVQSIDEAEYTQNHYTSMLNGFSTQTYDSVDFTERMVQYIYPDYDQPTFIDVASWIFNRQVYSASLFATTITDVLQYMYSSNFLYNTNRTTPIHFAMLNGVPVTLAEYEAGQIIPKTEPLAHIDAVRFPVFPIPLGAEFDIEIDVTNFGKETSEGYISVGFPDFTSSDDNTTNITTDGDTYSAGGTIWTKDNEQIPAEYLLAETVEMA